VTQQTNADPDTKIALPHFVVTGCARSATTYTAQLLSAAGAPCTHEAVFGPRTARFSGWGAASGDSSWLAVPFLEELPAETVVVHQLREPRRAIDALVRFQLFSTSGSGLGRSARALMRHLRGGGVRAFTRALDPRRRLARGVRLRGDFSSFLQQHCAEAFLEPNDVARATRHWIVWNDRIERASKAAGLPYVQMQIERLDAAALSSVLDTLGRSTDGSVVSAALASVGKEANRQPGGPSSPITRDVLGETLASELESAARRYGYTTRVT
jgi:hypothetical protein